MLEQRESLVGVCRPTTCFVNVGSQFLGSCSNVNVFQRSATTRITRIASIVSTCSITIHIISIAKTVLDICAQISKIYHSTILYKNWFKIT